MEGNAVELPECLRGQRVVVVDVETTGFDPVKGRVIELGLIWIEDDEVVMELSTLFNPRMSLSPEIVQLTGIQQHEVDEAAEFDTMMPFINEMAAHPGILVAYNSKFDMDFIAHEFLRRSSLFEVHSIVDPLPWVRREDGAQKCNLGEAARRRGISVENAHRALGDCRTTLKLLNTLNLPTNLDDTLEVQKRLPRNSLWRGINGRR